MTELMTVFLGVAAGLSMVSLGLATLALSRALDAITEVKAMQQSTHQIQYVQPDEITSAKEVSKELNKIDQQALFDIEDQQADLDELAEGAL